MKILIAFVLLSVASFAAVAEEQEAETAFDDLVRIEAARVGAAYIDPNADFGAFRRVAILDPLVAFRSNWQRDMNRSRSRNISSRDMERIKEDISSNFRRVFSERLEAAGFQIVNTPDYDVLVLRPAIIDLDITAPDTMQAGRTRTFTSTAGAATIYVQLIDSVSGAVIGRAVDRRVVRQAGGQVMWSNRVTNVAEARRTMGRWADVLVDFLTSHYYQPGNEEEAPAAE